MNIMTELAFEYYFKDMKQICMKCIQKEKPGRGPIVLQNL